MHLTEKMSVENAISNPQDFAQDKTEKYTTVIALHLLPTTKRLLQTQTWSKYKKT